MTDTKTADIQINVVSRWDVDHVWPLIVHRFVDCLKKVPSSITAGQIWTTCRTGEWFLIIACRGEEIVGSSVWRFASAGTPPEEFVDCVILAGDDLESWLPPLIETATEIGKANGCKGLTASGRPGFGKLLKTCLPNLKVARVTVEYEFEDQVA